MRYCSLVRAFARSLVCSFARSLGEGRQIDRKADQNTPIVKKSSDTELNPSDRWQKLRSILGVPKKRLFRVFRAWPRFFDVRGNMGTNSLDVT
jgi:hypothetical protein